ncbi:fibronectin type III domain-containing protein [Spirilliplanes yamanashiensis]|uniref:Fibronectin type III domain-containing protein n=1 Tax=Spirilliplanes yamanashiensis TaxID=42233 RepID=A0A8J3Y3C6_9ACTN|nr:fibronectin type III domain-containing protein [Spirilliplanes yamanashiensis]MDP9814310.1 LPXTG-motif cell wall-anchored protein [Spirilliplanes yamanashiensis]GIJ00707.1 hypothetical protein Sya03_00590 [Spirilliplanes yamanashiensis]
MPARILVAGLLAAAGTTAVVTGTASPAWACHGLLYGNPVRSTSGFTFEVTSSFPSASNITVQANNGTATISGTSWTNGAPPLVATVTGLNPGQSSTVQVNADLSNGGTACSSYANSATTAPAQAPATGAATATATGFTFTITNYNGAVYDYTFSETNGATATDDGNGLVTVTGLAAGASSTVTVTATAKNNSGFTGSANTAVTGTATPPAPAAPDAPAKPTTVAGDSSAAITWAPPAANGSTITGYVVTAAPGGATCTGGAGATTCLIGGLSNGVAYRFTVTATSDQGPSPASAASNTTTPVRTANKDIAIDRASVEPGGTVTLRAEGYRPGASVRFTFYSTPVVLGSATAGGNGVATLTAALPAGAALGAHTVRALGVGASGRPLSQDIDVRVAAATGGGGGDEDEGGLPVTGPGATATAGVALALLLAGAALVLATRRRRTV